MIKFERALSGMLMPGSYEIADKTLRFELAIVCNNKVIRYKNRYDSVDMSNGIWDACQFNKRKAYKWKYDEK